MFTLTIDPALEKGRNSTSEREGLNLLRPAAYFSVSDRHDKAAIRGTRARQEDHAMWQEELPDDDKDDRLTIARLRRSTGRGDRYVTSAVSAHRRLRQLPKLKRLQERHYHLDLARLKLIDSVLNKIDGSNDDHIAIVDDEITAYLTPTRANQDLPTPGQLDKKLNAIIQPFDTSEPEQCDPLPDRKDRFTVGYDGDRSHVSLETDAKTGKEIEERVRAYASSHNVSQTEALSALLSGEEESKSTTDSPHAYDTPDSPTPETRNSHRTPSTTDDLNSPSATMQDRARRRSLRLGRHAAPDRFRRGAVSLSRRLLRGRV
ncbi:hypothetical protein [Corynebacterium nasicanis]|uniref:Uncharacterized protein n=1 Tax=Corynebacterium nasicanis TaxID=1448267 RepID=A0ABW1QAK2_9CORY